MFEWGTVGWNLLCAMYILLEKSSLILFQCIEIMVFLFVRVHSLSLLIVKNRNKWIDGEIKSWKRTMIILYYLAKINANLSDADKQYERQYCKALSRAKNLYFDKSILKLYNKSKTVWNIIKKIERRKYRNKKL